MIIRQGFTGNVRGPSLHGSILRPGTDPPIVTPYCGICSMPVERFCMDVVTDPHKVGIHAQCCGKTSSIRISVEELFRIKRSNEKLFVVTSKGHVQTIKPLAKTGPPPQIRIYSR